MTIQSFELGKEYPPEGEKALIQNILEMCKSSMGNAPNAPMFRDQHPKSHGYVRGDFIVEDTIHKVGIFAKRKKYRTWIRFSNGGSERDQDGAFLPDAAGDIRGMAIKLMGVKGEMAMENPSHQGEQDFILMNSPTFFLRDVQGYIDFLPVLKAIREIKQKKGSFEPQRDVQNCPSDLRAKFYNISYAFPFIDKIRAKAKNDLSPLAIRYWSATPYKFGKSAIKFSVIPRGPISFKPQVATEARNYLREAMIQHLKTQDAYFDFKIQLQTDALEMPIEDPTKEWDEQKSPYIKVATIKIPKQEFDTKKRRKLDEKTSFSPWYCLRDHQPLGGVNRARKIYTKLARFRNERNQGQ